MASCTAFWASSTASCFFCRARASSSRFFCSFQASFTRSSSSFALSKQIAAYEKESKARQELIQNLIDQKEREKEAWENHYEALKEQYSQQRWPASGQ